MVQLLFVKDTAAFQPPSFFHFQPSHDVIAPFTTPRPVASQISLHAALPPPNKNGGEWNLLQIDSGSASLFLNRTLLPVLFFVGQSLFAALILIGWEHITCTNTLPSRHRTTLLIANDENNKNSWGSSTIHGLAFGQTQRQQLLADGDLSHIPSYNEVGLYHRKEQVPRWKQQQQQQQQQSSDAATHVLLACLQTINSLQDAASNYQWESIQTSLRSEPLTELERAASTLRPVVDSEGNENVVGFDWGSCAWRHCGALADAQEALDELEHLLGVLEPFEAIFCLDIVERSLRDILAVVPWEQMTVNDQTMWQNMPAYVSKVSTQELSGDDGEDRASHLDEEYFQALQEFRVD